jgi:predicted aspartyl protease
MLAVTLSEAKNIAIALVAALIVAAFAAAWIMQTIIQKVAVAAVLALLAFAVFTQRTSLQDCADKVQSAYARQGANVTLQDTDCSFFGVTITIRDPRTDDAIG